MMLLFVLVFVLFDLFRFVRNRNCSGVDGWECCNGFALNILTGKCERCPIGYHGYNCSEKCIYPTYDEDCQSVCRCSKDDCRFAHGCSKYVTDYQHLNTTTRIKTTTISTGEASHITISFLNGYRDFSTDNSKFTDTTLTYLTSEFDLFKNNLVVHVIISLIGAFVFFFAIFVFTYIYFKCFRKTTNIGGVRETDWQAQYKSLRFDSVEPQIPFHPEPQRRVNTDFTYLTPVFSRNNESRESRHTGETEIRNEREFLPETHLQEQTVSSQETKSRQNEPNITHDDVQEHVYIEITEEKAESSKLLAGSENENQRHINIVQSTSICTDSACTNVDNEKL